MKNRGKTKAGNSMAVLLLIPVPFPLHDGEYLYHIFKDE
jgi:hypothetical protein